MVRSIFFLTDQEADFSYAGSEHPTDALVPSLLLKSSALESAAAAYRVFSKDQLCPGALTVLLDSELTVDFLRQLVSFLFLPCYAIANGRWNIGLLLPGDANPAEEIQKLHSFLAKQGLDKFSIQLLTDTGNPEKLMTAAEAYLFRSKADVEIFLSNRISTGEYDDSAGYFYEPTASLSEVSALLNKTRDEFKLRHPVIVRLADELHITKDQNLRRQKQFAAAASELDNYKTHIDWMRSGHEAAELQEYYNREYETLPLWYKQFGHIIKVIIGKRSFRSLFSDNVKKYED